MISYDIIMLYLNDLNVLSFCLEKKKEQSHKLNTEYSTILIK